MDKVEKVDTPAVAARTFTPESTPPEGLLPMATVIVAVEVVTVLPKVS
jgi:hypothetical protein